MKKRILAITLIIASLVLAGCSVDTSQLAGSVNNVKIPNIIGKSLDDAKSELSSVGLQIGDIRYEDSDKAKDTVILSDPLPGTSVEGNSKINLTLSSGAAREKTLTIKMDVPAGNSEIEFAVYIDGVMDRTKKVDPSVSSTVTFKIKGSKGKKAVTIKDDGNPYKEYTLDFDKNLVIEN